MWVSKKRKLGENSGKTHRVKPKANEEGFLRVVNEAFFFFPSPLQEGQGGYKGQVRPGRGWSRLCHMLFWPFP